MEVIDVTVLAPHLKHPHIFKKFDSLAGGDSFVIMNNHDPGPLYDRLMSERGAIAGWEYLEKGPQVWKVKITRLDEKQDETIGEIVTKDIRKAKVFRKYGIDFCCGGKKSLKDACEKKNIDPEKLAADLREVERDHTTMPGNPDEWELDFLANYIVNIHHSYVKSTIPVLLAWSQKVAAVHGNTHPEAIRIAELFATVAEELMMHMMKEEKILFPYITGMTNSVREGKKCCRPDSVRLRTRSA